MDLFKRLSFQSKILMTVAVACLICGGVAVGVAIHYNEEEFRDGLVEKSRTIHGRLDVVAKYVANQGGLKTMIDRYVKLYKDSSQLTEDDKKVILQQVPIYAAMRVGSEGAEKENYKFRVFSDEPRNKENAGTPEEMAIFRRFAEDSGLKEIVTNEPHRVVVYRPVRLAENHGCLNCHGAPNTSPWGNGRDILGYKMEDWRDGKLHGVFAVENYTEVVAKAAVASGKESSTKYLAIFIICGALVALLISGLVARGPLRELRSIASSLSSSGEELTAASGKISSTSQALSSASNEQAASLGQTAASLEEISAMIAKASSNATSTASSASESQKKAESGKASMDQMMVSMEEIRLSNDAIMNQINQSNQQISEIVTVIQEIGNKTKVINDIVFQTKLLSFNASVEAARAGEHGKGFAVVAEEVGNLAQMSGNAAKEISDMLQESISKVESIVQDTKVKVEGLIGDGKHKVEMGVGVARQCATMLNEIVEDVNKVTGLAQEISNASQEQSIGVGEINKAMSQLDSVTQQNAATSVEAAEASEQLSTQANSLKTAVLELVRVIEGHAEGSPASSSPAQGRRLKVVGSTDSQAA